MSIIPLARRHFLPLLLLCCGLIPQARLEAANLDPIILSNWLQPTLEYGNANKIAIGKFNYLHGVFTNWDLGSYSDVYYLVYDPVNQYWDYQLLSWDGTSSQPALALDTGQIMNNGLAAVAWVSKSSPQDPLGSIYYSYQTQLNCNWCWSSPAQIVYLGTEPSLTAENGNIHLTWTTGDRLQYTTFPRTSPPATPLWLGEVIEFTNCPNTRLHRPSIALTHAPCQPQVLRVAALFTANEQETVGPCHDAATWSGLRLYERNATTSAWSIWQDEVTADANANQPDPVAVSLSMNANRMTGDFYVAWSDEQGVAARTMAGHATATNWVTNPLSNQRQHVHVAARTGGSFGHFRLASAGEGWTTSSNTQTYKWNGGVMTPTGPLTAVPNPSDYSQVGNPQALYWRRCAANQLSERTVYTQAASSSPQWLPTEVATDLTQTGVPHCKFILSQLTAVPDCWHTVVSIAQMAPAGGGNAGNAVLVDLGDTAVVTKLNEAGAEITTPAGGTIQATWMPGEVLFSWENGFAVATTRDSVRFSSQDLEFTVQDHGTLGANGGK